MTHFSKPLAVLALALGALVASSPRPAAEEPKAWRHGILEAKSDAGFIMMVGRGFDARQNIKVDLVQFKSDVVEMQALMSGEIDSFDSGVYLAIIAASRGADIRVIGCPWPGMPYGILVRGDISSVQDLKGKSVAISAPGASPDLVARALLAQHGMTSADVRLANLGGDVDRYKALAAGVVDAAVTTIEYIPVAERQGIRVLVMGRDVLPNNMRFCIVTSDRTLAGRRGDAVRFLAAEIAAWRHAVSHRDEAVALSRQITGSKPDDPRAVFFLEDAVRSGSVDPEMSIPVDKLGWAAEQLAKDGSLPRVFDVTRMIEPGVRAEAVKLAGPGDR